MTRQTDTIMSTSGPLVSPLAAAGDVSSDEALQLFGLLCSLLKLQGINSSAAVASSDDTMADIASLHLMAVADFEQQQSHWLVATAILSMLSTALRSGFSCPP
jgi:hypothetical protein